MEPNTKKRYKQVRQIYWPRCKVCQFMKKNPVFRLRVMQSKYFLPSGHESLTEVVHSFGDPFSMTAIYMHMGRHQTNDVQAARKRFDAIDKGRSGVPAVVAVEGEVVSSTQHEQGLDEFIKQGKEKLQRGEMTISATNYLAAIKIRSDIDKNTKDRRLDMIKSFFAGGDKKDA